MRFTNNRLLYPNSPLHARQPDEQYAAEVNAVRAAGFEVSFFSLDGFQSGEFRPVSVINLMFHKTALEVF